MPIMLHIERMVVDEALMQGQRATTLRTGFEETLSKWLAQHADLNQFRAMGTVHAMQPAVLPAEKRAGQHFSERLASAVGERLVVPQSPPVRTDKR